MAHRRSARNRVESAFPRGRSGRDRRAVAIVLTLAVGGLSAACAEATPPGETEVRSAWAMEEPAEPPAPLGLPDDARYQGELSASMHAHLATAAALERRSCDGHPALPDDARAVHVYTVDRPLELVRDQVAAELAALSDGERAADAGRPPAVPPVRRAPLNLGEPDDLARLSDELGIEWPAGFLDRYRQAFPRLRDAVGSVVEFTVEPTGSLPGTPWSADVACFTIRLTRPYLDLATLQLHDRTAVQYIVGPELGDH